MNRSERRTAKCICHRLLFFLLISALPIHSQLTSDSSITYIHKEHASFKSQFLQGVFTIVGAKKSIGRTVKRQMFSHDPASVPLKLRTRYECTVTEKNNRQIWRIKPDNKISKKVILYIHGGAYIYNISLFQWSLVDQLLRRTNATMIVPDYPLAPDAKYKDVYLFIQEIYDELLTTTSPEDIILLGDSAGGGLAFGFSQMIRNENKPQPSDIILLSPWLDITMRNPDIKQFEKKDKLLEIKGLRMAGKVYADSLDCMDYRVSPIYGDFTGLGNISVFIGTNDLFIADARKLKNIFDTSDIPINYFEYPKMFHVWVIVKRLRESRCALDQIADLINK